MSTLSASIEAITASLPPETDHLTYLTILDAHLTKDLLPHLFEILQDVELTAHIGWDLIGLLVPLLPASTACLHEVARLGNPREVILKVTEALREIAFEERSGEQDEQEDGIDEASVQGPEESRTDEDGSTESTSPTPVLRFTTLLDLLSIVHPRIKTKYPSRFLSSTLKAVLATYRHATRCLSPSEVNEVTHSVVDLIITLSGCKRPSFPPRHADPNAQPTASLLTAPDPEAHGESPSEEEEAMVNRLLQSFVTHILEDYFLSLASDDEDVPGMAWAARFHEIAHPEKVISGRPTFGQYFMESSSLQDRETTAGELVVGFSVSVSPSLIFMRKAISYVKY